MQETTQHSILASLILSETPGGDTKPNKHEKQERIRKCLKATLQLKSSNNIVNIWSLKLYLLKIF